VIKGNKKQNALFSYGHEFSPVHPWLLPLILISGLACILSVGMGVFSGPSYFQFTHFLNEPNLYTVDPLVSRMYPAIAPPLLGLFAGIADIPFTHFIIGSLVKLGMVGVFYLLAWQITRSTLASLIGVFILFGVADFSIDNYQVLNLRIPIVGASGIGFREPVFLNYRAVAMLFILGSTLFFWRRQLILSSVLLALGVYCHAVNSLIFFVGFCGALVVSLFLERDLRKFLYDFFKFTLPLLIIISPYIAGTMSMFSEVIPIDFASYWSFAVKNEPDDMSPIWYFIYFKSLFLVGFVLTVIAGCLHLVFKSAKPIKGKELKSHLLSGDLTLPLLFAPWLILGFAMVWEVSLIPFLPNFLNEIIATMTFRRITIVSAVVYVPILSIVLCRIFLLLIRLSCLEVIGRPKLERLRLPLEKIKLVSGEQVISVVLVFLTLAYILCLNNKNISTFKNYFIFNPMPYDYFLDDNFPAYQPTVGSPGKVVPVSALLDVCEWVKRNTTRDAAIIGPSYMGRTRVYCQRQGFLQERDDGNLAAHNRKFATLYLERFYDLHKGLTYYDLPIKFDGPVSVESVLRERYLSIVEPDIESLKRKYPGYGYFMTEASHNLKYPLLFKNDYFYFYDIR